MGKFTTAGAPTVPPTGSLKQDAAFVPTREALVGVAALWLAGR